MPACTVRPPAPPPDRRFPGGVFRFGPARSVLVLRRGRVPPAGQGATGRPIRRERHIAVFVDTHDVVPAAASGTDRHGDADEPERSLASCGNAACAGRVRAGRPKSASGWLSEREGDGFWGLFPSGGRIRGCGKQGKAPACGGSSALAGSAVALAAVPGGASSGGGAFPDPPGRGRRQSAIAALSARAAGKGRFRLFSALSGHPAAVFRGATPFVPASPGGRPRAVGRARFQSQRAMGGRLIRMASILPPVFSPNSVPRS